MIYLFESDVKDFIIEGLKSNRCFILRNNNKNIELLDKWFRKSIIAFNREYINVSYIPSFPLKDNPKIEFCQLFNDSLLKNDNEIIIMR